jgi:hypothetical protein
MSLSNSPKRTSRKNGLPVPLHHKLDYKLLGYAAAASAAGVGMMALPSQAEIVYTPTHQTVPQGGSLALDLNHDGVTDFILNSYRQSCSSGPGCEFQQLTLPRIGRNRVLGTYGEMSFAQRLPPHKKIGASGNFHAYFSYAKMDRCKATRTSYYLSGQWQRTQDSYLGLEFNIGGEIHYGWARLTVTVLGWRCNASALLTGYAYETVPNRPIVTGKTSGADEVGQTRHSAATLGMLALGSAELAAWRRDEDADLRGIAVDSTL